MKKLITMVIMMTTMLANADITNDFDNAEALYLNQNYNGAVVAFEKLITDYPTANKDILASAQYDIGQCYKYTRDYSAAAIAYNKVIADYPDAENSILARAQCGIGHCLIAQGKNGDEAYLAMLKYGDNNILRSLIDKVAATMSVENYIKFLTRVLMVVSATEENSEFLGKVKSKLELLK